MKKHVVSIVLIIFTIIPCVALGQSDSAAFWVKAGFSMAPQAYWRIGDTVAPRQLATPLFVAGSLNTKTISVGVFYNFANNSIGTFPMLIIGGKGGVYPVATKSLSKSGGYIGIGTGYFVGNNALFLEVGSLWGQGPFKPTLSTGAFIPLQKIIFQKKKKC